MESSTVYFVDGTQKEYTPKQLTYIVTEEEKDLTSYYKIVVDNIMLDVQAVLDKKEENIDTVATILKIMEEHDVSIYESQMIIDAITRNLVNSHNKIMEKKVGKIVKQFNIEMDRYKDISQMISDSHKKIICESVGRYYGTYDPNEHYELAWDNIKLSHIKQHM